MCNQQIKSPNAALLNSLYEMQASPTYAFRKMVLLQAENTILKLESERSELLEALKRTQRFISEIGNAGGKFAGLHGDVVSESYRENAAAIDVIDRAEGRF